jgi:hypothetical protein
LEQIEELARREDHDSPIDVESLQVHVTSYEEVSVASNGGGRHQVVFFIDGLMASGW